MRTRTRVTDPINVNYGDLATGEPLSYTFHRLYEHMIDTNNGRKRPLSPCTHYSVRYTNVPKVVTKWRNYGFIQEATARSDWFSTHNDVLSRALSIFDVADRDFRRQAQKVIDKNTRVADELSLLNNLVELDDLPDLIKKYRSLGETLVSRKRKLFDDGKVRFVDSKGNLSEEPNYLDWKFALEPLLLDIRTLSNNLRDASSRLHTIASGLPRPISHYLRIGLDRTWDYGYRGTLLGIQGPFTGTLSGTLSTYVPGMDEASFQMKMLADMIGLHIDAKLLYDAMPFTWLLDWFVPIGDFLGSLNDRKWVQVDIDGGYSVSTKFEGDFRYFEGRPDRPFHGWNKTDFTEGAGKVALYRRRTAYFGKHKDQSLVPKMPEYSEQKLAIIAALGRGFQLSNRKR